jgi:hypothetical protein
VKIRIKDNAVRFRITLKELERLRAEGLLASETRVLGPAGPAGVFRYAVLRDPGAKESNLEMGDRDMTMRLAQRDFEALASDDQEGVYIRREWTDHDGSVRRFMVFVEKDRPGSVCDKPEEWVYEERIGARPVTRPIPSRP